MHSAVLDATGYTLLLSSFITLVILLWKGCKRKKKLSFYVLSASDVFSTILTAIILLVNHIDDGIRLSYNWQNNTNGDIFNAWTMGDDYRFPFLQTHPREAVNEVDLNVTLTCGMQDLLMQYGMLIATLTNAFISLLTFTVQCNLNAVCAKRRCADVMRSLKNIQLESKNVEVKCQDNEMLKNEEEPASQQGDNINVKNRSNIIQRSMKISNFRTLKEDDKRPTNFLVMSHWLVPFLVVGMLYFAEYNDMNDARDAEDIECIFGSNFPMNDFDTFSVTDDNLNITGSVTYMTLSENNYFFNEMPSNKSKPSSAEIDEVVSKVQGIVRTALRYASNSTMKITDFHNTPRLQNLTQYILIHNLMKYIKNITNVNGVQGLNSTLIEEDISVHNSSTDNNIHLNQDPEVSLLYDVSKNASKESDVTTSESLGSVVSQVSINNKDDSHQEDAQIYFASTEESTTQTTTDTSIVQNATFVSNNQIYDEIMKRIQAASAYSAKNHYNHYNHLVSRPKDGDQPKISSLKNYMEKRKPNSIKDLFSNKNDNRYINTRTEQNNSLHMTNECLVSTKFLKLQLFVLSFTIYFLPILLSCILQMRGKHTCKNILAMLRAKTDLTSKDDKKIHRQNSVEGSSTSQRSRNHSWTDIDAIEKDHESCKENESMTLEIECMVRIFDTITLSLILCIVFWTPVFLGTLLRVHSCIRAPQWLNDITFLSAVSFGIVRNALNINIIRIQEACRSDNMKENRIHPVK